MRFVRTSESSDRCKSVPTLGAGVDRARRREVKRYKGRRKKKRLSPFFLFGVAIERVGDQVVNTCFASKYGVLLPIYLQRQNSRLYGISCQIVGICLSRFVPQAAPLKNR